MHTSGIRDSDSPAGQVLHLFLGTVSATKILKIPDVFIGLWGSTSKEVHVPPGQKQQLSGVEEEDEVQYGLVVPVKPVTNPRESRGHGKDPSGSGAEVPAFELVET